MKRQPHVRRIYLPPEEPERVSLALLLEVFALGVAVVGVLALIMVFVVLPLMAAP